MARRVLTLLGLLAFASLATTCDQDPARERSSARPTGPPHSASGRREAEDEGGIFPSADPPALAGDLRAELDGFTTVEGCVSAHAGVDPLVGDALEEIGYDTLLQDACRALEAAKKRSSKGCEGIAASSLRTHCEARVAELAGDPDECPWDVPSRPERGRDPVCLAVAQGDVRPCAAALTAMDRVSCEAIATRSATPCAKLPGPSERVRCERDVQRWSGALSAAEHPESSEAVLGRAGLTKADDAGTESLSIDVSRGVVVVARIDGAHVVVGPSFEAGSGFVAASPNSQASLALELVIPADRGKARVERGELRLPGRPTTTIDRPQVTALSVHVARFALQRSGAFEVTVSGRLALEGGVRLDADISTFVRDTVTGRALALALPGASPAARPPLGDAGRMR